MKTRTYFWLSSLIGLLSLTTCTHKEVGPSINDLVGKYDFYLKWYGGWEWNKGLVKSCQISKSAKGDNIVEMKIEFDEYSTETWEVKYFTGGGLVMDKQILYSNPTTYGYTIKRSQEAIGKFTGDSLMLEGERFYEPVIFLGRTYCKYWAKKKS